MPWCFEISVNYFYGSFFYYLVLAVFLGERAETKRIMRPISKKSHYRVQGTSKDIPLQLSLTCSRHFLLLGVRPDSVGCIIDGRLLICWVKVLVYEQSYGTSALSLATLCLTSRLKYLCSSRWLTDVTAFGTVLHWYFHILPFTLPRYLSLSLLYLQKKK